MEGLDHHNIDNHHDPVFLLAPLGRNREEEDDDDDDDDEEAEDDEDVMDDEDDHNNNGHNNANNNNHENNNNNNHHNANLNLVNNDADNIDLIENNGVLEGGVAEFYEPLHGHRNAQQADIVSPIRLTVNIDEKNMSFHPESESLGYGRMLSDLNSVVLCGKYKSRM
jgi:hypothetical protein